MTDDGTTPSSLFTQPTMVVSQKAKVIEVTNQYRVSDADGNHLASVNQVGQSKAKKMLRLVSNLDQFMTHKLEITDVGGAVLLRLTRPAKVLKSTVIVSDANDVEIGRIAQDNVFGKIHFSIQIGGATVGAIKAENWRAWDFRIEDETGAEVARVSKQYAGALKEIFTTADNYMVSIPTPLAQPFASMVVAAALSIDTALKQDDRA